MKKHLSLATLTRQETTWGWIWWSIQLFLLPTALSAGNQLLASPLSRTELNFVYFVLNFLAMMLIFRRFLLKSLRFAIEKPGRLFLAVLIGLVLYYALSLSTVKVILRIYPDFQNANDALIADFREDNPCLTFFGTVLLTPVAEECFYRGLFFQNPAKKSLLLGYLLSASAFSLIHILGYIGQISGLAFVLSFLQYLPAGFCLAWSYEVSGTIVAPILMHMIINACSIL